MTDYFIGSSAVLQ